MQNSKNILKVQLKPRTLEEKKEMIKLGHEQLEHLSNHLKRHTERNLNTKHINYEIYHLLTRPYTFINAYAKISKNKGALTKEIKTDKEVNRFFGLESARSLAKKFRNKTYTFKPTRRIWIDKSGKTTKRPLDTPTQKDRIVQEAIRGILEAIFEPEFKEFEMLNKFQSTNFGFRPGKSTWNAALTIQRNGPRTTHVIEGDFKNAYNSVTHKRLLSLLQKRIKDQSFLNLIEQLLKCGIMEKEIFTKTTLGTPQGVSPILFNIYLFEFDKYIYNQQILPKIKPEQKRKANPKYNQINHQIQLLLSQLKNQKKRN